MKKLTNDLVIERCKSLYGNALDYSKVNYVNSRTPIILICPIHGEFKLYANNVLQGRGGCPLCKKTIPDKESFIKLSNKIHNNKYDYSKLDFIDASKKVKIICPIHGEFELIARHHAIEGCGCPKCAIESRSKKRILTLEQFIEKAKQIHGDKYDYTKTNYIKSDIKVIITCSIHGDFEIRPHHHLLGLGCPKCGHIKVQNSNRMSIKDFIEKANLDISINMITVKLYIEIQTKK